MPISADVIASMFLIEIGNTISMFISIFRLAYVYYYFCKYRNYSYISPEKLTFQQPLLYICAYNIE